MTAISDIKFTQDQYNRYDISASNGDLDLTQGFDSAILISLLTDARADKSQISRPEKRRGWVGNVMSIVIGRQLGSFLWLVDQRRLISQTVIDTVDYANKSLKWMIDDKVVKKIDISGEIIPKQGIALNVILTAFDGSTSNQYVKLWEATGL
jgi:phage gp46-like protein